MGIEFNDIVADLVPDVLVETDLTGARVGLPALTKKLCLVGHKTSAGDATLGVAYLCTDVDTAIARFGIGSDSAIMVEAALRVSPLIPVYAMAYAESAGTAASGTITVADTATGAGTLTVHVAGRSFRIAVESGDLDTEISTNVAAAINGHPNLPVTATANDGGDGITTLTCRLKGPAGNSIAYRSEITSGITTSTTDAAAFLASGATDPDPTSSLALIASKRFHIYALNTEDSTTGASLETHIGSLSSAQEQRWGCGVQGITGNAAALASWASAIDNYRMQGVWHYKSDKPCYEIAAAFAAERCRVVNRKQSLNYHRLPGISAQYDETAHPDRADELACIRAGGIPLRPMDDGSVEIVRNVHSKITTPAYRDAEITEISDYLDEALIERFKARYSDAALKTASPAQQPNTLTPARAKALIGEVLLEAEALDYVQGTETIIKKKMIVAEQNAQEATRLDMGFPFIPSQRFHVGAIKKSYSTPDFLD